MRELSRHVPAPGPSESGDVSRESMRMLSRGWLYTIATAAPLLSGAAFTPFTTRILGPREYGVAVICVVVTQIGSLVLPLGLPAAVTRHVILEPSGAQGGRALLVRALGLSVALALVLAVTSRAWAPGVLGHSWRVAVVWASLAGAALGGVATSQAFLRGVDRVGAFTAVAAAASLLGQGLGLVGALVGKTADAYLLGLLVGYGIAAAVGVFASLDGSPARARGELRDALRIGLPTVPHQVATYLGTGALILVAGHQLGTVSAARLQIALLVGSVPGLLVTSMNNSWAPTIYRASGRGRAALLEQTAVHLAWLMAACSIGVAAVSPYVLRIVAPRTFAPQDLLLPTALSAWVGTIAVAYLASVHLVFAEGRSTALAITTPFSLLLAVGVAVLAARRESLSGIAAGLPAFYVSQSVLVRVLSLRVSPTRWSMSRVIPPIVVCGIVSVASSALPVSGPGAAARGLLASLVAAAVLVWGYRQWSR